MTEAHHKASRHHQVLLNQMSPQRGGRRLFNCRLGQLVAPFFLFVALGMQLTVRVTTLATGYELEALRREALSNDARLRELRRDYAYLTQPIALWGKGEEALGLSLLESKRLRRISPVRGVENNAK